MQKIVLTVTLEFSDPIAPSGAPIILQNVMDALTHQIAEYGIAPDDSESMTTKITLECADPVVEPETWERLQFSRLSL